MIDFMQACLLNFYEASHWNPDNNFASLTNLSKRMNLSVCVSLRWVSLLGLQGTADSILD
jgi:hypothetical protein